jgi:hypothetical protein
MARKKSKVAPGELRSEMAASELAAATAFQILFECASFCFAGEGEGCFDFPRPAGGTEVKN